MEEMFFDELGMFNEKVSDIGTKIDICGDKAAKNSIVTLRSEVSMMLKSISIGGKINPTCVNYLKRANNILTDINSFISDEIKDVLPVNTTAEVSYSVK